MTNTFIGMLYKTLMSYLTTFKTTIVKNKFILSVLVYVCVLTLVVSALALIFCLNTESEVFYTNNYRIDNAFTVSYYGHFNNAETNVNYAYYNNYGVINTSSNNDTSSIVVSDPIGEAIKLPEYQPLLSKIPVWGREDSKKLLESLFIKTNA